MNRQDSSIQLVYSFINVKKILGVTKGNNKLFPNVYYARFLIGSNVITPIPTIGYDPITKIGLFEDGYNDST